MIEVLLCTFNGERFVVEQLHSILAQTLPVQLISVYDDGSTDSTLQRLAQCAEHAAAAGVRLNITVNPRNLGYAQNFGQALAAATGDTLLLCDQDDVWEPQKVAQLAAALQRSGSALAFSDGTLIDADGAAITGATVLEQYGLHGARRERFGEQAWTALLRRNVVNGAAMALQRDFAQAALPIPAGYPHDYWLALCAAARGGITCLPQALYRYRQHRGNVIGMGSAAWRHQLASIWRDPAAPRRVELLRSQALLGRFPGDAAQRRLAERKHAWLLGVSAETRRIRRLCNIAAAWLSGDYARFAVPQALLRDLISALR